MLDNRYAEFLARKACEHLDGVESKGTSLFETVGTANAA